MAATVPQICNLALSHIRLNQTSIANLDTDGGNVAATLRAHYDICRQFLLSNYPWNFASKFHALALLKTDDNSSWCYQYEYPNDCLRLLSIDSKYVKDPKPPIPYEIGLNENNKEIIYCNLEQAYCTYTANIKNSELFSAGFVSAFAWYLASEIAAPLTESNSIQQTCYAMYQTNLNKAMMVDANESQPYSDSALYDAYYEHNLNIIDG